MSSYTNHPFHLVDKSPWPVLSAFSTITLVTGLAKWFHTFSINLLILGLLSTALIMIQWWRDVTREGTFQGNHTSIVGIGLRWGIILFITSEVLFFLSFFWAFFHRSLAPAIELGSLWPPQGIKPFNPFQIPLLNTAILLASGVTVTWAHHALIEGNHSQTSQGLLLTVVLGIYFTSLQALEYFEAPFCIADAVYGSTFFVATGFHGLHVIIGTLFLAVCLLRHNLGHFSLSHHFGFEAAAWYWHFVDVVWLFLFVSIYWWGGYLLSIFMYIWLPTKRALFEEKIMILVGTITVTLILIVTVVIILTLLLATKKSLNREKATPFECGFDRNISRKIPFSIRFFLITIIFLIFDVEVVLLLPAVKALNFSSIFSWWITLSTFLIVLLAGLLHEWKQGALNWSF